MTADQTKKLMLRSYKRLQNPYEIPESSAAVGPILDDIVAVLAEHDVFVTREHVAPFAAEVEFRRRVRSRELQRLTTRSSSEPYDILRFITDVKGSDADEALWRAVLATHFGRLSADNAVQRDSAGQLLCGFTDEPVWTWERVSANLST